MTVSLNARLDEQVTPIVAAAGLEVPPDLSQLSKDNRSAPGGVISASTFQAAGTSTTGRGSGGATAQPASSAAQASG